MTLAKTSAMGLSRPEDVVQEPSSAPLTCSFLSQNPQVELNLNLSGQKQNMDVKLNTQLFSLNSRLSLLSNKRRDVAQSLPALCSQIPVRPLFCFPVSMRLPCVVAGHPCERPAPVAGEFVTHCWSLACPTPGAHTTVMFSLESVG